MICLIAAVSKNNVIGKNGKLPWHIPNDLVHFKAVTTGHIVVMGRKTFESIGKPLPNRYNIVLGRSYDITVEDIVRLSEEDWENEKFFIIGGEEIYRQFLPYADRLYITHVEAIIEDGDTFFPEVNWEEWNLEKSEVHYANKHNDYDCEFCIYERVNKN